MDENDPLSNKNIDPHLVTIAPMASFTPNQLQS